MALQAALPNLPIYSEMAGNTLPWTANTNTNTEHLISNHDGHLESKESSSCKKSLSNILSRWLKKTSNAPLRISPPVSPSDNIEAQVDRAWRTLRMQPQLCSKGTYRKFKAKLDDFANVYGSDGAKIFWDMILEDLQRYFDAANAPGTRCRESTKLVLGGLLDRAQRQAERTTVARGTTLSRSHTSPLQRNPHRQPTFVIVPAPAGRGYEGKRTTWLRSCHVSNEQQFANNNSLQRHKTKIINIGGRQLQVRAHPFDNTYLQKREVAGCARFEKRLAGGSPKYSNPGPSALSQSVTAEMVQYPTFSQKQARWTLTTLGKLTAYASLSACVVSITKKYKWEGISRSQALSILKQLESRRDLLVRVGAECGTTNSDSREGQERYVNKTTVERRVQCIKAVLAQMAKEYATARDAFGRGIHGGNGMVDLAKVGRVAIPGQQDVRLVQELVTELLEGRS
ncbi:hypothetical protein HRR78_003577 [Exophiala dermatitidis]|nr:hypothetical protein HRR75_002957 [Exophiala dermatitidis]KAJ4552011.1 hypothetical protein HRR78_003577 [Exophiala dermatitidis]